MAKVQKLLCTPQIVLDVRTIFNNGDYVSRIIKKDEIETFRYVKDHSIQTISGRVKDISLTRYHIPRKYTNPNTIQSYFAIDNTDPCVDIDISTKWFSNIEHIDCREIIEDYGIKNVDRIQTIPSYGFNLHIELSDGSIQDIEVRENKKIVNMVYTTENGDKSYTCLLIAITYDDDYNPLKLETLCDEKIREFDIKKIKSIEKIIEPSQEIMEDFDGDITVEDINNVLNS